MSLRISTHAIERYVERIDPSASWDQARAVLLDAMGTASRLKEKSYAGDTIFATPALRLVVAEENGHREVLTVLPPDCKKQEALPELAEQLAAEFDEWERTQVLERTSVPLQDDEEPGPEHYHGSPSMRRLAAGLARRQHLIGVLMGRLANATQVQPPKASPNSELAHELHQALAQLAAAQRRLAVQVAHARRMEEDREQMKRRYSAVLRFVLVGDLAGALAEAEQQDAGFIEYLRGRP